MTHEGASRFQTDRIMDELAEIRIARAQMALGRQHQLVTKLPASGEMAQIARSLEQRMETILATMIRHRALAARKVFQAFTRNRLLAALPPATFRVLAGHLSPIALTTTDALLQPGKPVESIIFIESGVASITVRTGTRELEVAVVGHDGLVGIPAILEAERGPLCCVVHTPGDGLQISGAQLREVMAADTAIRKQVHRYVHAFNVNLALGAAAIGLASVEERVARWILLRHDRLEGDAFAATHEELASLLGVRRASVTDALHRLEGVHAVKSTRARIVVCDRTALEQAARNSYGTAEAEYDRLFAGDRPTILRHQYISQSAQR